ncbi:MAG: 5-methyltetrahydropteroyltriglutamate--homocysteine S-methyltransferase [Lachnospiraceae bacterium]|nr:5-methyltetrahydropteroyltriglutamate--homocysteine S-methyltransferase [Lachnospiraceae bacterium]
MKVSVSGFPRVGKDRELKFAEEKYFRGEISEDILQKVARELRLSHWQEQKKAGIDLIPSNDFSFYDQLLDTAVLFNIIPERYKTLDLSDLERYFAMARGYQGSKGDVKALAMKKWFNTNYHYMVPEIDDDTFIELKNPSEAKPLQEYREAKAQGIETKPVVIGPFTLLKLLKYKGSKSAFDYKCILAKEYFKLITAFENAGVQWLQLDEPYLVRDLSPEDIELFEIIYKKILPARTQLKVLLNTYFGDVRDIYPKLLELNFDGIGLDFLEGKETVNLIERYGFPKDKILFAGLVNGKNIWKNNYEKTLEVLSRLSANGICFAISTSCSLLHVPYSVEAETKLPDHVKDAFAFAKEKLQELADLKELTDLKKLTDLKELAEGTGQAESATDQDGSQFKAVLLNHPIYQANQKSLRERKNVEDKAVQERVAAIREEDYTRLPSFEEREELQKRTFHLPEFPTTTIGSFPQTLDVKKTRKAFRNGEISEEEYEKFNQDKIAEWIGIQEEIGLDVLVHGEFERNDMVEYFGDHLKGYVFTEKAWVQSYGSRCVKPPIIWGDVSRSKAITVEWSKFAQSLTDKPVKGMLTGPVTILNWSFPREDISLKESTQQIALAIRDEVLDLEAAGIKIIQIDEAALREKLPLRKSDWYSQYLDWAIPAFRLVHSGVQADTQIHTHMCYSEFTDIIPAIDAMDADVITFEASRSDLLILDSLAENHFRTEVGPGVYDIHSPRVPSVEEITKALGKMLEKVEAKKLWVNPDCGLKTRGVPETLASLKNLVAAAKEIRQANS